MANNTNNISRAPQKKSQNLIATSTPLRQNGGTFLRRREHVYSTIEDEMNDDAADDDDDIGRQLSDAASDHGIYSEPEHFYSCIDDVKRSGTAGTKGNVGSGAKVNVGSGTKVNVVVEKDSDISEEETSHAGKPVGEENKKTNGGIEKKGENGRNTNNLQMPQLAKALFDNAPESTDEVGFRRGDVLKVLERDHNGLVGWALVQHQGKTGIAPQNRLRLLAGMYDGGGDGHGDGGGGKETEAKSQWNRRSWAIEPDKVLTPRKVGDVYIYDQSNQDYDVPPSRYFPSALNTPPPRSQHQQQQQQAGDIYDTPQRLLHQQYHHQQQPTDLYDSPRSLALKNSGLPPFGLAPQGPGYSDYDTPQGSSKRSSTVSMLSTGSAASNLTPSSSARSSAAGSDFQGGIYDVPPTAKPMSLSRSVLTPDTRKLDMALESLEMYDIPKNLKMGNVSNQSFESSMEIYDTPPKLRAHKQEDFDDYDYAMIPEDSSSRISSDSGVETKMESLHIAEDIYDIPPSQKGSAPALAPKKGSRCSLQGLMPSTVPEDLYDVPPMVSRDAPAIAQTSQTPPSLLLRNKSGRSGVVKDCASMDVRSSVCSENSSSGSSDIPSVSYKELKVDLPTALEQLKAAQDDVNKSSKRLLGFVSSTWRSKENLEENLFDVKVSCIAVRTATQEFVEFSEGTVANSVKVQDKKLVKNLVKNLEPVQGFLKQVEQAMKRLEEKKWMLSKLVVETPHCTQTDELGTIVNVARMLPEHCRTLHTIIQANAQLLFEAPGVEIRKSKPARPPPPTMPKPNRSQSVDKSDKSDTTKNQRRSIQERPLPTPPRPLPKPPSDLSISSSGSDTPAKSSLSRHSSAVSSNSRSSRSRSRSPTPPLTFRARSNSDYDNNWGNMADARDSTVSEVAEDQVDYVSLDETAKSPESVHFTLQTDSNRTSMVDNLGYEMPTPSALTNSFSERLKKVQNSVDETMKASKAKKRSTLPNGQNTYDSTPGQSNDRDSVWMLDDNDKLLLSFYSDETVTLTKRLVDVIDQFFEVMQSNDGKQQKSDSSAPLPQTLVEYSKAVIVAGQKLVFICDTITRNVTAGDVRDKVLACACHLCECLKETVTATKNAGRKYPDVVALQDMNDRLVDVTHAANEVKLVITQAASL